jgi:chromate reductase, NAD(P)H dehydrogenase (quinone)
MPEPLRILAVSGSLRSASLNTLLLRLAQEQAPAGVQVELYDGLGTLPHYNEDLEHDPGAEVEELRELVRAADALLIATPEYNGTIPGALKNLIDWASRPYGLSALVGKPVGVMGASPSPFAAAWARDELRKSLTIAGARVLESSLGVGKSHERLEEPDEALRDSLTAFLVEVAEHAAEEAVAA